jgi:hypothetical protein
MADIETLVNAHLAVWNSEDADQRTLAMAPVYAKNVRTEESDASYAGHTGMNEAIAGLHGALPGMRLSLDGPIQQAQDLVTYQWNLGKPDEGIVAVTGRDVLLIDNGQIAALYVLINN